METLFEQFGTLLNQNILFSMITALIAGIISSFTPCCLSSIPLVIGYVGLNNDENSDKRNPLIYSLMYSFGQALTFTILGIISATIGGFFSQIGSLWYIFLGILLIVVFLQMVNILNLGVNSCNVIKRKKGILGAFLLGILGGIFSSPCSTPVLIAILAFAAENGNVLFGGLLLLIYSIGHSILIIIAGTSFGIVKNISKFSNNKVVNIIKYIFAVLILLLAFYMFYLGF